MAYQRLLELLNDAEMRLINEFIFTFMRLEYALKATYVPPGNNLEAKANWDTFVSNISPIFDKNKSPILQHSVDLLLANPPKKQIIDNGSLKFIDALEPHPSDTQKLNIYIRRVTNNLFHGGKFTQNNDFPRDLALINASLIVLKEWVEILPSVREKFHEPIL